LPFIFLNGLGFTEFIHATVALAQIVMEILFIFFLQKNKKIAVDSWK
jgi:hypothetical protein